MLLLIALLLPWTPASGATVSNISPPLLILGDSQYPPVAYLEDGEPKGMDVDLARLVASAMHREVKIELMDWSLAQKKVLSGEADVLLGLSISEERRKSYEFAMPSFTREFGLVVRKGETLIRKPGDLKGKSVAVTAGGFPRSYFEKQPGVQLVVVDDYKEGLMQLAGGKVDAVAADLWVAAYIIDSARIRGVSIVGRPFATAQGALAVRKGNVALLNELNEAIKSLTAQGKLSRIQEDWRPEEMLFMSRERFHIWVSLGVGSFLLLLVAALWSRNVTLRRQNQMRLEIEAALRSSEERFELSVRGSTDGLWDWNVLTNEVYYAVRFRELIGFTEEEFPNTFAAFQTRLHPEDVTRVLESIDRHLTSRAAYDVEYRLLTKSGEYRWFRARGQAIWDATGKPTRMAGSITDISAQKQAVHDLKESEERYRTLVEFSPICIAISIDERVVFVNPVGARMFGADSPAAIIGRTVFDFIPPELHETMRKRRQEVLELGMAVPPMVTTNVRLDGTALMIETQAVPLVYLGKPAVLHLIRDITNRMKAEKALQESEARLLAAFNNLPFDFWVTDIEGRYQLQNAASTQRWGNLLGKRLEELELPAILLEEFTENNRRALKGKVIRHEMKVVRNEEERIVTSILAPVLVDGVVRGVLGTNIDVTDRVKAAEELRENQRVLSTLLSNLPGMVYRCRNDLDWTMEFVSEGCRELTGYSARELTNNARIAYADLIHADDKVPVWEQVQAALERCIPFELTYRIRTGEGAEKWVWERGTGIRSPDNSVVAIEGFITDITARRKAEAEREGALHREQKARSEFTRQLIASQEAERSRIAGELHDSLGQNLLLIKNRAQLAQGFNPEQSNVRQQLEEIGKVSTQAIAEVRQISHDLRPYQLDQLGLSRAISGMLLNTQQSSRLKVVSKIEMVDDVFTGDAATNLYRIVQEALNNILKHSRAENVSVRLERDLHQVNLVVQDDGCGFDPEAMKSSGGTGGFGLRNITERIRILEGSVRFDSAPGKGTKLSAQIPIKVEE